MKMRTHCQMVALLALLTPLVWAVLGPPGAALAQQAPGQQPPGQQPTVQRPSGQQAPIDPKSVSLTVADLRPGFTLNTDPAQTGAREPAPGLMVYEADFTRERTERNLNSGPVEIKSLVARAANAQQATEQFNLSRQALVGANPPWTTSSVATLGDEAVGLSLTGGSPNGPAVAHLYLFRKGNMVVGITVAGLEKPTRMAEAEALAAVILRRIDPDAASRRAPNVPRTVSARPAGTPAAARSAPASPAVPSPAGRQGVASVRVANTDGVGVNLRASPSTSARIAAVLPEGTVLELIGGDRQAEGRTWKNVRAAEHGSGWVAGEYTAAVAGATPTSAGEGTATPASPAATASQARPAASPGPSRPAAPATSPAPASATPTSVSTSAPGAAGGTLLTVAVVPAAAEVAAEPQTVAVTVTRDGRPVENARVAIEVRYGDGNSEAQQAPPTDAQGLSEATWTPAGPPGQVGIGVVATAPDGTTGAGSASFRLR